MKPRSVTTDSTFSAVFSRLRAVLAEHEGEMVVSKDTDTHYDLWAPQKYMGRPLHFAGVKLGKTGVFLHFFPSYVFPVVNVKSPARLRDRRHGKNCYNFRDVDAPLFDDVAALVGRGLQLYRDRGLLER